VRDRAYQAIIQPVQAVSPANPGSPAPGDYEEIRRFGDNAETHIIGLKREASPAITLGPGHYEPSVVLTKEKKREAHIDPSSPARRQEPGVGPGQYEEHRTFEKDTIQYTI